MPIAFESQQIIAYGQAATNVLVVVLLGGLFYYLVRRGINTLHHNNYITEAMRIIFQITWRWAIIILVLLTSLQQLGIQLTSIWAALSAFVVFVGVGLVAVWSVLSNVLCSLLLLIFRPFTIGDKVEIIEATGGTGLQGKVVNLNLLYTFIVEDNHNGADNKAIVQVPNNTFFQKTIRRWPGVETSTLEDTIFKDDAEMVKQNA